MEAKVYNQENKEIGTVKLPEKIFGVAWKPALVRQALEAEVSNRRRPLADAKGRGEVRGGGRKPWQQKGLGRARHGSIRSPIWKGGGVTHGPSKERNFAKKINKKMKRLALYSALSKKAADQEIKIISALELPEAKTKNMARIFKAFFPSRKPSVLVVFAPGNKNITRAAKNIPKTKVLEPKSLNVYECLSHKYIFFEKEAVGQLT